MDPAGRHYYWTNGVSIEMDLTPGSDAATVAAGRVSITPLSVDLDRPIPDWDAAPWAAAIAAAYSKEPADGLA